MPNLIPPLYSRLYLNGEKGAIWFSKKLYVTQLGDSLNLWNISNTRNKNIKPLYLFLDIFCTCSSPFLQPTELLEASWEATDLLEVTWEARDLLEVFTRFWPGILRVSDLTTHFLSILSSEINLKSVNFYSMAFKLIKLWMCVNNRKFALCIKRNVFIAF